LENEDGLMFELRFGTVKAVLLIDDMCTTGTQFDAVAGCLLDQGRATRVEGVVLGRAPWRGPGS
jgi:predicted amidophosphoribosyltransferase